MTTQAGVKCALIDILVNRGPNSYEYEMDLRIII